MLGAPLPASAPLPLHPWLLPSPSLVPPLARHSQNQLTAGSVPWCNFLDPSSILAKRRGDWHKPSNKATSLSNLQQPARQPAQAPYQRCAHTRWSGPHHGPRNLPRLHPWPGPSPLVLSPLSTPVLVRSFILTSSRPSLVSQVSLAFFFPSLHPPHAPLQINKDQSLRF